MLAAPVWTYWIAFPLFAGAVLAVIALGIGYLIKVVSAKYPKK